MKCMYRSITSWFLAVNTDEPEVIHRKVVGVLISFVKCTYCKLMSCNNSKCINFIIIQAPLVLAIFILNAAYTRQLVSF